jgi:serine/threonine protein kinase
MTLSVGTRLGPYEILSPLGAGGMGEVYRARDAKLGRDVAIKVLPEAVAEDAERLARFQREAQTQPAFKAGKPETLFEGQFELRTAPLRNYDVSHDGKQFVFVRGGSDLGARELNVVLIWAQELGGRLK